MFINFLLLTFSQPFKILTPCRIAATSNNHKAFITILFAGFRLLQYRQSYLKAMISYFRGKLNNISYRYCHPAYIRRE